MPTLAFAEAIALGALGRMAELELRVANVATLVSNLWEPLIQIAFRLQAPAHTAAARPLLERAVTGSATVCGLVSRVGAVRGGHYAKARLAAGSMPANVEINHEGRCGRCGRALTVPESVASGIGPESALKMAA